MCVERERERLRWKHAIFFSFLFLGILFAFYFYCCHTRIQRGCMCASPPPIVIHARYCVSFFSRSPRTIPNVGRCTEKKIIIFSGRWSTAPAARMICIILSASVPSVRTRRTEMFVVKRKKEKRVKRTRRYECYTADGPAYVYIVYYRCNWFIDNYTVRTCIGVAREKKTIGPHEFATFHVCAESPVRTQSYFVSERDQFG